MKDIIKKIWNEISGLCYLYLGLFVPIFFSFSIISFIVFCTENNEINIVDQRLGDIPNIIGNAIVVFIQDKALYYDTFFLATIITVLGIGLVIYCAVNNEEDMEKRQTNSSEQTDNNSV